MAAVADGGNGLKAALDQNVHDGLRLASGVLAGLIGFFVVVDLVITPPPHAIQVALVDLVITSVFLGAHLIYRKEVLGPDKAHLVGTILALCVVAGNAHDSYLLADPEQTAYLMLVVVAAGSIFLNSRALYVVLGASLTSFLVVASLRPGVNWTTFGFALFAACVLSALIHAVRVQNFARMERLRAEESGRKEQLEIRESALEAAVEALQESEERYRRLVEGAPDAFLVHSGGRVVYANDAAARLLGATAPADLLGREMASFVHPDHRAAFRERSALVEKEGHTTDPAEMVCLRLDGSKVEVDAVGQPIAYLGRPADQTVLRDLTDRKRAQEERRVASERLAEISRLKEMDRVKTQFVNTISHELRTPLTPIKVQLHVLRGAKEEEARKKATDMLERNVVRLSSLVDELLEVARIQAGTLKLAKTYVELGPVVAQSVESFVDVAREQGVELRSTIAPDVHILGDAKRLQQILYNLLGNAFKFTDKGGVVEIEVLRDGAQAIVCVRDTGTGLEPDEIARLFEPFSQVHDTMEKTNAGTGLGLYICRGIVEGHGGRIWAESEGRRKGACFSFAIPLAS